MFRISGWFFVALFFSVHCLQKQTWYSRLYKGVTNSPITLLYGKGVSFVYCAGLCTGDDYCIEFLYSETSGLCIGHHYVKKGSYSYQYVLPASPRMLYFKKELNWVEYAGHFYFFGKEEVKWRDAKLGCQKICAHLVEIETKEESDWLWDTFLNKVGCNTYLGCSLWTGGNDLATEGQFVWDHSNTTISFFNWSSDNPSIRYPNQAPTRNCIDMTYKGKWNDRRCSYLNSFICEKVM